ncbi:MAG TPA: enoyl-CoA hydratase-related protein [Mycobacteriales bacterium]|jgi:enoyl-CoA hydratase/carnithine racemase|nr:enoyl-CoA hydratase-related protein [Mycobacteriales bacterium]
MSTESERESWALDDLRAERNEAGEPLVLRELRDDGVLLLTLNRPERGNAWEADMEVAYFDAFDEAVTNPDVRAIVLTGAGKLFCAGMDMARLHKSSQEGASYKMPRRPQTFLLRVPKPVIAAVNGACAGIGLIQAVMCDVRFTSAPAKWTAPFTRLGLPAEDALAWRLQHLAGNAVASDLLLSARVVTGADVARWGIALEALEPADVLPRALEYAADVAQRSPTAMAVIKQQLLADAQQGVEISRRRARQQLIGLKQHPDFAEGVRAFSAKEVPAFLGLDPSYGCLDDSVDALQPEGYVE